MRALSFLVGGELFAVDINGVQKVTRKMKLTYVPTAPDEVIGIMNLKGKVITVFSLTRLLGRKEERDGEHTDDAINAVVFKSFSDSEDQMGLNIDKPGDLIEIDDDIICPPSLTTGALESFCISGIAEMGQKLYRIIDIDSVISKYKNNSEETAKNISNGGINNGQYN
jgi:purine-binding chemotaxis protein CheW